MTPLEYKELFESEEFEEKFSYLERDLGMQIKGDQVQFKIWTPFTEIARIQFYDNATGSEAVLIREMESKGNGIWFFEASLDTLPPFYLYELHEKEKVRIAMDPYAVACGVNGERAMILDLTTTDPEDWEEDSQFQAHTNRPVLYELHIKDFSYDLKGGFSEENRGKFKAFTEKGTSFENKAKYSTGIDYIKELNVTHVHLLPMFDFGSIDETAGADQFNWGYDPKNYNVPEGSYSSDPYNGATRIREMKEMIKAFHDAGIGVVMDVVYNHTYSLESCFEQMVPFYYYRQDKGGNFSDGSACGNETASERIMMREFMIQSLLFWAKEYHLDGFRFDLMGLHDVETMNQIRKELDCLPKKILLYGEPWTAGPSPMKESSLPAKKSNLHYLDNGISIFSDDTRDLIKGSVFDPHDAGFINGGSGLEKKMRHVIEAWTDGDHDFLPRSQKQIISYVSAHDNFTLWDKLTYTRGKGEDFSKKRKKTLAENKLAAILIFTSKGIPFFQAGEEFGRTKGGEENSYNLSPDINKIDWERRVLFQDLVEYYKGLIQVSRKLLTGEDRIFFYDFGKNILAFSRKTPSGEQIFVVINVRTSSKKVKLPSGKWSLIGDDEKIYYPFRVKYEEKNYKLKGKSAVLFIKNRKN